MKDFALQLEGCSKSDRKKSNGASKGAGFHRYKPDGRFLKRDNVGFVYYELNDKTFNYCDSAPEDCPIYQMPQDWELIKAALGIEVRPKDVLNHITNNILKVDYIGKHDYMSNDPNINGVVFKIAKPSTKEAYENQKAKHRIADIVEKYGRRNAADVIEKDNRIKELEKENELFKCRIKELTDQCDEIYANNKPNVIINELNAKIEAKDNRIKELEEINKAQRRKEIELRGKIGMLEESRVTIAKKVVTSNNELNVEIETKDKRIAELEKNLIIMCELGNKVL